MNKQDAIYRMFASRAAVLETEAKQRADSDKYKPLMQAVEEILENGHMNTEQLARLRFAWESI
jgi:DNA-directed RNA polymerase subunit K/omega